MTSDQELRDATDRLGRYFARGVVSRGGVCCLTKTGPLADALEIDEVHPRRSHRGWCSLSWRAKRYAPIAPCKLVAIVGDMNWDGEHIDGMSNDDATPLTGLRPHQNRAANRSRPQSIRTLLFRVTPAIRAR